MRREYPVLRPEASLIERLRHGQLNHVTHRAFQRRERALRTCLCPSHGFASGNRFAVVSFCYVDDLVEGMLRMMETEKGFTGPTNLGNPTESTMIELAAKVIALVGTKSKLVHRPLPPDDPKQRRPDIGMAQAKLGWIPKVGVEDGLRETIAYFKRTLAR